MLVGVPLMTPVVVLKFKPVLAFKSGLIDQETIGPPTVTEGELFVIEVLTV